MLHGDMSKDDTFLQYTTIGWMMWPWMVSTLAVGASIVLYDGSPLRPDALCLFRIVETLRLSVLGVSAKYLQQLEHDNVAFDGIDVSSLRLMLSTASPLGAETMRWCYTHIKQDMQLASITGGTDIIGLFAGGCPTLAVHAGQLQCSCLAMDISTANGSDTGDLVCRCPFPSMPVCFWGDTPDKELYRGTYFSGGSGSWHHGDYVHFDRKTGGIVMLGRSDGTLNPSGIRFGSADIYRALDPLVHQKLLIDALVVGVRRLSDDDEHVVLFVQTDGSGKLAEHSDALTVDEALRDAICRAIRTALSPRHVPSTILLAPSIPYTPNGKKIEVAVKRLLSEQHPSGDPQLAFFDSLIGRNFLC